MPLLNPMNIGPSWPGNYQQPDYRVPAPNAAIASYAAGSNSLNLSWPIPQYSQSGTGAPPAPSLPSVPYNLGQSH